MRSFLQGGTDVFVPLYQKISYFFFISLIFYFQPLIEKKVVKWYKIATFRWNCNVSGEVMANVQDFRQIATFRWNCNVSGEVMANVQKWYKNGTMPILPRVQ
nr:MAG TPA: hypothetical protein [Caudoviricetes sp.]